MKENKHYACDPMMADAQFVSAKAEYIQRTGRIRGKDDVIAYHMRQAFAPGEITPEEANRLGRELAMRLTHGNNAFVVATHTDKHHIHNHMNDLRNTFRHLPTVEGGAPVVITDDN